MQNSKWNTDPLADIAIVLILLVLWLLLPTAQECVL